MAFERQDMSSKERALVGAVIRGQVVLSLCISRGMLAHVNGLRVITAQIFEEVRTIKVTLGAVIKV